MSVNMAVAVYTMTPGRIAGSIAALVALAGVVVGVVVLVRSRGRATGRRGPAFALAAGLAGILGGGLVVAAADGGPGTGYGIVGGFVALVLGLLAAGIGGLALANSRRVRPQGPGVARERPSVRNGH
jgi:uncharacterized protein DUF6223